MSIIMANYGGVLSSMARRNFIRFCLVLLMLFSTTACERSEKRTYPETSMSSKDSFNFDGTFKHNLRVGKLGNWRFETWMACSAGAPWDRIDIYLLATPPDEKSATNSTIQLALFLLKANDGSQVRDAEVNPVWEKKGDQLYVVVRDAFKTNVYSNDKHVRREQIDPGFYEIQAKITVNSVLIFHFEKLPYVAFIGDYKDFGGLEWGKKGVGRSD